MKSVFAGRWNRSRSSLWWILPVLLIGATTASPMSIRELRTLEKADKKQGANYVRYYLVGVMEGTLEAHAQGVRQGAKPHICINGRRIEPRMAQELLESELKRNANVYEADMPVTLVMNNALATVYSC